MAKLADLPNNVLKRANELLSEYESKNEAKDKKVKQFELNLVENNDELRESAIKYGKSPYGKHLMMVADGKVRY